MTPAARLSAAMEVLAEIFNRYQPPALALKEWGRARRFAGSSDRAVIGNLVYDVLRRKDSLAWLMQSDTPRALVLALYVHFWIGSLPHRGRDRVGAVISREFAANDAPHLTSPCNSDLSELPPAMPKSGLPDLGWGEELRWAIETLTQLCGGDNHAPSPMTEEERARLALGFKGAPLHVKTFMPEWMISRLLAVYVNEESLEKEGVAMAERAPVDLRVNTLKSTRDKSLKQLERFHAALCIHSPFGIRIPYGSHEARSPHIETEGLYQRGHVELQDEASQLVSLLTGVKPGDQVADLCAGGGGKTLALAALMENKGQIVASDSDKYRLAPIYERLKRAGAHNVQVLPPDKTGPYHERMDKVVLDVPCTGTGAWRRRPDNKWRLSEKNITERIAEQDAILKSGATYLRPGGELAYITCSILREENEDRVQAFLGSDTGKSFKPVDMQQRWRSLLGSEPPPQPDGVKDLGLGLRLSPYSSGTDGFFIACLQKQT